jgi:hypothetical protein
VKSVRQLASTLVVAARRQCKDQPHAEEAAKQPSRSMGYTPRL